jgi:Uncharacterized conserved protein
MVKALVVKGVPISTAINRLISAEEEKERRKVTKEERREDQQKKGGEEKESKIILRLRGLLKGKGKRIGLLEERVIALKASVKEKDREIRRLKRKLDSVRSESTREIRKTEETRKRDAEIERLREEVSARENENAELRRIVEGLKGEGIREVKGGKRIKVIPSFSHDAIVETDRKYGLNRG